MQSRLQSLVESAVGTAIGFIIAVLTQIVVFHLWNLKVTIWDNLAITAIFTVVSAIRSYWVRRFFNWLHHRR